MFIHREQFGESFAYDDDNNLLSTTTLADKKSSMEYDDFDNLISYVQPGANSTDKYLFTYGSTDAAKKKHLVETESTPMGVKQHYTYDSYGNRLTAKTQKDGETSHIQTSSAYDTGDVYDALGNRTESVYSGGNYAVSTTDARGNSVTKQIDAESGLVYNVTDPAGQSVGYTYDSSKRVTSVVAAVDTSVYKNEYTYANDRIATVSHNTENANCDVIYTFGYDALGRKTTVAVGNQTLSTNVYTNDRDGLLSEVRYGDDGVTYESEDRSVRVVGKIAYTYDDFDRVTSVTHDDESTPRYEYEYGANGQASFLRENHLGRTTQTEYDLSERPCQTTIRDTETDELIYRTSLEYDEMNRLAAFREQTAHGSHETTFSYDKDNRPTAIQYGDASHKLEYTYDGLGRVTIRKVTNGASEYSTSYEFVAGDTVKYGAGATTPLVKKITQPEMNFEYEYDSRGNIISETRNGLVTRYEYDALGQLTYVSDPHEDAVWFYDYDLGGNILEKRKYTRNDDGTCGVLDEKTTFRYENQNWKDQLTGYTITRYENGAESEAITRTITYDRIGNPLDDGERRYEWESGRVLKKITMKDDPANGIMDGVDEVSGTTVQITFSGSNLLAGNVTSAVAAVHVIQNEADVTDDYPESEFSWHRHSGNAAADAAWDAAHTGVKEVTFTTADLVGNTKFTCTLTHDADAFGSVSVDDTFMASHTRGATDAGDTLSLVNGTLSATSDGNSYELQDNRLVASNTALNGTVTATGWVYTSMPDKVIEFKYNAAGLRVQKDVTANGITETTKYILRGKHIAEMICGEDKLYFFYDAQNRPTKVNFNGELYTYVHSLQGDVVGIVSNAGELVVEYKYDTWGKLLSCTNSIADTLGKLNPFRYRGYVYDEENGLYYLRSRYYNPVRGRFISADTLLGHVGTLGSHNLFAYCSNMPVENKDPDGMDWILAPEAYGPGYGVPTVGLQAPGWVSSLWGYITALLSNSEPIVVSNEGSQSIPKSTLKPSPSPSPSPTPKPTIAPTTTPDPGPDFYIAIAYEGGAPRPVSGALTSQRAYETLHTIKAAENVAKLVADSSYANISKYVYGVYTYRSEDAYNLAKRFGDSKPRPDTERGTNSTKMNHYNVTTPGYKDIHFWYFY